jgi:CheY-like chemotaxis protein
METVVKTGEQAAHLTRQMLAYSGKGKFLVESLDLSALARDIIELVRPSIPKKVVVNLELDGALPAIEADRGQVQQILMNLAINAAEAIGSHAGQVTVMTGTQVVDDDYLRRHPDAAELPPGRYVVLEVRDTGCGMDSAVKTKIFDPFFSTKFTGRGLGLAAVAGIVRGHKGAIVVTSAPGRGSTFSVLFPPAAQPAKEAPAAAPSHIAQGSGVVLVVDDEQIVRDMAQRVLERHGYTVLVADGGLAAIDILKRRPGKVDMVLLDLSMPGMSGEETLPELRKIRPEVKVLVSSGYSESEAMIMFRGQRVSGFLQKPYSSAVLADKVNRALE